MKKSFSRITASLLVSALMPMQALAANLSTINSGNGSVGVNGNTTTVTNNGALLDLTWNNLDVGKNQTLTFNQANSAWTVNHVKNGTPVVWEGIINGKGNVAVLADSLFITNTGRVNLGSFTASTARDYSFDGSVMKLSNYGNGSIINQGNITAAADGHVILLGNSIINTGNITANKGDIVMESAKSNELHFADGKFQYDVPQANTTYVPTSIVNTGNLTAKSGMIEVSTHNLQDLRSGVINLSGVLDATAFGGGQAGTVLVNSSSDLNAGGKVSAGLISTTAAGTNNFTGNYVAAGNGSVNIIGHDIAVNGTITAKNRTFYTDGDVTLAQAKVAGQPYGLNVIGEDKLAPAAGDTSVYGKNITIADQKDNKITSNLSLYTGSDGGVKMLDANDTINGSVRVAAGSGGIQLGNINAGKGGDATFVTPGAVKLGNVTADYVAVAGSNYSEIPNKAAPSSVNIGNINASYAHLESSGAVTTGNINLAATDSAAVPDVDLGTSDDAALYINAHTSVRTGDVTVTRTSANDAAATIDVNAERGNINMGDLKATASSTKGNAYSNIILTAANGAVNVGDVTSSATTTAKTIASSSGLGSGSGGGFDTRSVGIGGGISVSFSAGGEAIANTSIGGKNNVNIGSVNVNSNSKYGYADSTLEFVSTNGTTAFNGPNFIVSAKGQASASHVLNDYDLAPGGSPVVFNNISNYAINALDEKGKTDPAGDHTTEIDF